MAATPFKGLLKLKTSSGIVQYYFTASDVADAHYIWQDGSSYLQIPPTYGECVVVDLILTASGVDTTTGNLFVNSKDTGVVVLDGVNLTTTIGRQFQNGAGIVIPAGSKVDFVLKA